MTKSYEMKAFLRDSQKYFANELEAAMKEGKRKANRAKITMVGPGRAGKTCVARSFLNMQFENTPSTQGIDDLGLRTTVHQAEAREGRWGEFREFDKMYEGYIAQYIIDKRREGETYPGTAVEMVALSDIPVDERYVQEKLAEHGDISTGTDFITQYIHNWQLVPKTRPAREEKATGETLVEKAETTPTKKHSKQIGEIRSDGRSVG